MSDLPPASDTVLGKLGAWLNPRHDDDARVRDIDPRVRDTDPRVRDTDPRVRDTDPRVRDTDPAYAT